MMNFMKEYRSSGPLKSVPESPLKSEGNQSARMLELNKNSILVEERRLRNTSSVDYEQQLLTRESALRKRPPITEELVRWPKKHPEEKRDRELFAQLVENHPLFGTQLWQQTMTGREERKYPDDANYGMSHVNLETCVYKRNCPSAEESSIISDVTASFSMSQSDTKVPRRTKNHRTVCAEKPVEKSNLTRNYADESVSGIPEIYTAVRCDKAEQISTDKGSETISILCQIEQIKNLGQCKNSEDSINLKKTPTEKSIDEKNRLAEIISGVSGPIIATEKIGRGQDLYITTYDLENLKINSDDALRGKPLEDIFGNEAEELWKKQMAIEQEIKQLEQQQKEQLPYMYVREIPNKPPPPYKPPQAKIVHQPLLPKSEQEIDELASYSSKIIFKAYQKETLDIVKFSENSFKLYSTLNLPKTCGEFMFNICRDLAKDHYKEYSQAELKKPSWLQASSKTHKPLDAVGLEKYFSQKLKEMFNFRRRKPTENNMKCGLKKRDMVDEILVVESQEEESQWTNFEKDELVVKDAITNELMNKLLDETVQVFSNILAAKKRLY